MYCILGIDIGTTGARALLVSAAGQIIASASSDYTLLIPRPGWSEQHPEEWWQACIRSIRNCLEEAQTSNHSITITGIGLTGQMHGSVFLDEKGKVIRPAILWNDQRTEEQCLQITDTIGLSKLIELTSNRALAGFTAPKILWLRQSEPESYARTCKILLPKDYIRYRLTSSVATEVSDASGTLLFNVRGRRWSEEMLTALDIPRQWLPDSYESTEISGRITAEAAAITGLSQGIPVVGGGGDQAAGAVGNGIINEGSASCSIGTSGVVFWPVDTPSFDNHGMLHSFCHAVPNKWHLMGVTLSAGGSLKWFRDTLCQDIKAEASARRLDPYEIIDAQAAGIPAGSEGLLFLPYLSGERTPHADTAARGAFIGLSLRHNRAHMARAVMEGVTMSLKDCIGLASACGISAHNMLLSGGGGRSDLWRQIAADIFNMEIRRINVDEGPAYGAAIIAATGAGMFSTIGEACAKLIQVTEYRKPDPVALSIYDRLYELYRPLYETLKPFFRKDYEFVGK